MDRQYFDSQLHDLLANIFDFPVLEKHPFADLLTGHDAGINRAEALRDIIHECIEQLKPGGTVPRLEIPEWRYYLILHGRYIDGLNSVDLEAKLALGERQLRRMHARAVEALESLLWLKLSPRAPKPFGDQSAGNNQVYSILIKPQVITRIIEEVIDLCKPRAKLKYVEIQSHFEQNLPMVHTDRVLIRQVLLAIISYILLNKPEGLIEIACKTDGIEVAINITAPSVQESKGLVNHTLDGKIDPYWLEQLGARLEILFTTPEDQPSIQVQLFLPKANYQSILIVDDQEPAIRMVQRYLTDAPFNVEGLTDSTDVPDFVRTRQPSAVFLDVMMPGVDGWEVLQALKSDPETSTIPVIVCSVWNEPEMAFSLGANGYLKKPFTQEDLLMALRHAGVMDMSVEYLPEDSAGLD